MTPAIAVENVSVQWVSRMSAQSTKSIYGPHIYILYLQTHMYVHSYIAKYDMAAMYMNNYLPSIYLSSLISRLYL